MTPRTPSTLDRQTHGDEPTTVPCGTQLEDTETLQEHPGEGLCLDHTLEYTCRDLAKSRGQHKRSFCEYSRIR